MNSCRWVKIGLGIALCAGLSACAKEKRSPIVPGVTTEAQLLQIKGQPQSVVEKAKDRPEAKLYFYADGEFFQIEKAHVVTETRPPRPDEVTLQSWKHRWRKVVPRPKYFQIAGTGGKVDDQPLFQLVAPSKKMAVVYDPRADRVIQVVSFDKR